MDEGQKIEIGMRYATDWYTYHASQRMTAVRFYLAIIGALLIAYVQAHATHPGWAVGIALFGALVSLVFWVLDVRNTELVNCGRCALEQLERELGLRVRADDVGREHLADASTVAKWVLPWVRLRWVQRVWRFQFWLRLLYGATLVGSILLALTALTNPWAPVIGLGPTGAHSAWSQVRALRTLIEEYLIAWKQETSDVVLAAQGTMLEAETLVVLRSCRLELGADPVCTRYEAWSDRVLEALRPLKTAKGEEAKAALQRFGAVYEQSLRAELTTFELEFGGRASRPGMRLDPVLLRPP